VLRECAHTQVHEVDRAADAHCCICDRHRSEQGGEAECDRGNVKQCAYRNAERRNNAGGAPFAGAARRDVEHVRSRCHIESEAGRHEEQQRMQRRNHERDDGFPSSRPRDVARASTSAIACCACCQLITGATSSSASCSDSVARRTIASPFGIAKPNSSSACLHSLSSSGRSAGSDFPVANTCACIPSCTIDDAICASVNSGLTLNVSSITQVRESG